MSRPKWRRSGVARAARRGCPRSRSHRAPTRGDRPARAPSPGRAAGELARGPPRGSSPRRGRSWRRAPATCGPTGASTRAVGLGRPLAPIRPASGACPVDPLLGGHERVHDAEDRRPSFSSSARSSTARVGAGELGVAALAATSWALRTVAMIGMSSVHAVDVPVEGALEVFGRRVLGGVERHPEDLGSSPRGPAAPRPQPAAQRHLGLVVEVHLAEDEHAVPVERSRHRRRNVSSAEPIAVDVEDLDPDDVRSAASW